MSILALRSLTKDLLSTGKWALSDGTHRQTDTQLTDIATYRLNRLRGPIQGEKKKITHYFNILGLGKLTYLFNMHFNRI